MRVNLKLRIVCEDYTPDRKAESSKHLPVNSARNSTYSFVTAGERAQARISNALVQSRDE